MVVNKSSILCNEKCDITHKVMLLAWIITFGILYSCSNESPKPSNNSNIPSSGFNKMQQDQAAGMSKPNNSNLPSSGFSPEQGQHNLTPSVSNLSNSDSAQLAKVPTNHSSDPFANVDDPSLHVCSANIGNVKYNEDGEFIGSKQPIKAILKFLKNDKCEEIKISYVSDLGEGERYPINWIYNTKINKLLSIQKGNGPKQVYSGLTKDNLTRFDQNGGKSELSLGSIPGVVEDEKMPTKEDIVGVGKKPEQSVWDGSILCVKQYIRENAKDAESVKFLEWSDLAVVNGNWAVRCKFKGTNSFGGIVTDDQWFLIENDQVIGEKE